MKKRIISLFLALTMLVGLAPAVFAAGKAFTDVSEADWFFTPVQWAVENGITSGLSDTEFGPNVTCTRAQVVTFLYAAANRPRLTNTENPFSDVAEYDWFYTPVLWAVENGITGGMTPDTFGPEEPCTRAQVVTFLYAAANRPEPAATVDPFSDVADADWFRKPVLWAVENGITSGLTPDTFGPEEPCTRGQIVTFLFAASKIGNAEPTPTPEVTPMPEVTPTLTPESGYAVCELEWNDGTVSAVVSAAADCTLAVALLDERGETALAETDIPVTAGAVLDTVTAPLQLAQMPDHYQLRAQLLDDNGNALCNPFVNRKHTTVYESFDALTESDFPADRVLDLVSSNDGNFAVLRDDVIWLAQTDENNILTSRIDGVCVFTNPDAVLLAVRTGDRIMFRDTDEQYAGVLVESVQLMNDGSLEIREAADTTISDFYSIIKIDVDLKGHAVNENGAVQLAAASSSGSGSDSKEENPYWVDVQMGPAVSNSVKTPFGSFGHSTTAGGKLELRFGFEDWDNYVEYTMLVGVKSEIDLLIGPTKSTESPNVPDKNSKDEEDKEKGILEICSITLAGLKDVADIPLTLSVVYDIECEAGLETTLSAEAMIGCVYNSNDGSQLVDYKDVSTGDIELKGSIEIEVGLLASISGELFDGKISAALGAEFGGVINGEAKAFIAPLLGTDEYHACDLCIDGKLGAYFDLGIKVEFEISKKLKGDIVDLDLLRVDWEIAKLYGSLFNHAQSVHGGIPTFDWGECPNKKYKITFRTYKNDIEENGHPVSVTSDAWGAQGGEDSVCQLYLYPGKYWAEADIGIQNDRQSFTVKDGTMTVTLKVKDPEIHGTVTDKETGDSIAGAVINVYKNDALIETTTSLSNGYYHVTVPAGTYTVVCAADDYESASTSEKEFLKNDTIDFALKEAAYGTVTGTVTDSNSGEPIEGVLVQAVLDDGLQKTTSTDSSGSYTMKLNGGKEWTLTFSKESYTSETNTVEVPKNETTTLNVALDPAGNERDIYIEYLLNGGYKDLFNDRYWKDYKIRMIRTNFGDFDGNGVKDLLLYMESFYAGQVSHCALYTIDKETNTVVRVRKAYCPGGTGGGQWLYLVPDKTTGEPTLVQWTNMRMGWAESNSELETFKLNEKEAVTTTSLESYEFNVMENDVFTKEAEAMMNGIHYLEQTNKLSTLTVYMIDGEQVTKEAYDEAHTVNRPFTQLPADHPFAPYVGTYNEPIRPDPES